MTTLLLDASAILAAFDDLNPHHEPARACVADDGASLATLDLARYEVTNVAVRSWRKADQVRLLLGLIDRIADDDGLVFSGNALLRDAAELAEREGISVYDASYVAAASQRGCRLVSCDVRDLVSKGLAILPGDVATG